ncbi:MAG: transcriptional regulator, AraC family [Clostridia bacterium]|jgi:AraC-like DNA-binding protein|nr:transcriptional regulator, AraC family [Clostridia bacterium]
MDDKTFWALNHSLMLEHKSRDYPFSMVSNHFHNEHEIFYLLSGERYYFISHQVYHIKKGSLVFIPSNEIHKTSMVTETSHERFLIYFKDSLFEKHRNVLGDISISELFLPTYPVLDLNTEEQQYIEHLLSFMLEEIQSQDLKYESLLLSKLTELFVFIIRKQAKWSADDKPQTAKSAKYKKVHEIASYISKYYLECGSLDEIAQKFFISKFYLCRIFKEVTGVTINEYINITKIRQAKILLEQSHLNMTQIAEAVGYDHLTYFEKVFKNYLNMTPLKYKKTYKKERHI